MSARARASAGGIVARLVRVYGSVIEMAWSAARARAAALIAVMIVMAVIGAVNALLSGAVVNALTSAEGDQAIRWGVAFMVASGGSLVLQDLLAFLQVDMSDRITHEVDRRLMAVAAGAPGLDHLERSDFADRMKQVRERQWLPAQLLQTLNSALYVLIGMAAALILLGRIHLALVALPFVMIPSAWLQFRAYRKHWALVDKAAPEQRLADHHLRLATQPVGAKEIRLFGLRDHLLAEHARLSRIYTRRLFRARLRQASSSTIGGVLYGGALTAAIAFLGALALDGRVSMGEVVVGVQVIRLMIGHVEMAAELVAGLAEMAYMGEKYLWLLRYRPAIEVRERDEAIPAPTVIRDGIRFEGVSFRYPGTEKPVLQGVDLFVPARSTVALVGENGAGKSSIVKLLCRFYDPTEGRITIDGVDLRMLDLDGWREGTATAFQDFVRFQLTALETVGVGDLGYAQDEQRVRTAVGFAGAQRVIDKLPQGLETQLGRQFKDGIDLSEGEWQRLAIARGSMRPEPALIVLDEPTASLDARAEHEVFERFAELARPRDGAKPVTVLVSHRFSTVRMADLIVVLHNGSIEELGSHEELMEAGGRYAELFRMQASRYG